MSRDNCNVRKRRCEAVAVAATFEWPYCKTYLWLMFGKLLRQAGLPNGRRDKFHKIRRSVASWFEVAGGNATELLGHSGREITRLYLDPTICQKPQAADRLFRPGMPV